MSQLNASFEPPLLAKLRAGLRRGTRLRDRLLRLAVDPSVPAFLGAERIEAAGRWIDVHIMSKRRQKRCRVQRSDSDTKEYLRSHFCARPFETLETAHNGLAFVCCPVWLPTPIGRLDQDLTAIWTGPVAQRIRASILDGSFRYCDHLNCSHITNRTLPRRDSAQARAILREDASVGNSFPKHVTLSHDKSCNLSCPSCRSTTYVANKAKQAELDALAESTILPMLAKAKSVTITGSGDPFGSNHFRNLIKRLDAEEFRHLELNLHTNGQLWDERAWVELGLRGRVRYAQISIDAAKAETYAIVRRGGSFVRLLDNLSFIEKLRRCGEISQLEFSMVVQARNFREMPAFVRLGREFGADTVSFQMIRKRDIFSADEFEAAFVGSPTHPDHREFVETLEAPELAHPCVQMGNVLAYLPRDRVRKGSLASGREAWHRL